MISSDPWIWLAALLSLSCFSLFYGDNKAFRWAETTYTASVVGHSVVTGLLTLRDRFYPLYTGANLTLVIPLILGFASLFVIWRRYAWVATLSMAVMIGVGTGISMRTLMASDVISNARAVIGETAGILKGPLPTQIGNLIRIVFTITTLVYFLFTLFPKGPLRKQFDYVTTLGKYALITYMGIALGNTIQQWVGCATSAIYRLVGLWLGLR